MTSTQSRTSKLFTLPVGQANSPQDFPLADIRMDGQRFNYEGNWLFCRFQNEQIPAARLGFGRGPWDCRDMGGSALNKPDFLFTHLELITAQGALLYTDATHFSAANFSQGQGAMDLALRQGDGTAVLSVSGWPRMSWHYRTPDGDVEVDLTIEPRRGVTLPDLLLPNNCFAMWVFIADVRGSARIGQQTVPLQGTAFFDRPRIHVMPHDVLPFGWLLYTPIVCADGSAIVSYLAAHADGRLMRDYCFAWRLLADNRSQWQQGGALQSLAMDGDDKPAAWRSAWGANAEAIRGSFQSVPGPILRTWGDPSSLLSRRQVGNLPLLFDAQLHVAGSDAPIAGTGVAEYIAVPGSSAATQAL